MKKMDQTQTTTMWVKENMSYNIMEKLTDIVKDEAQEFENVCKPLLNFLIMHNSIKTIKAQMYFW